jgi:hypothetical protein
MIALHNSLGQIDLSVIDPAEVANLDDNQQERLATLISAVQAREAAQIRCNSAVIAVGEASHEQTEALAAHIVASDPFPFSTAKIEAQLGRQLNAGEMQAARTDHEGRVRAYKEDAARKANIAAYNNSH